MLRSVTLVAASLWVGAMGTLALLSAPAAFRVLGRAEAGRLVGDLMPAYHWLGLGLAALALAGVAGRVARGDRRPRDWLALGLAGLFASLIGYALAVLLPEMAALGPPSPPGAAASAVERFGALHRRAAAVHALALAAAAALIGLEAWAASRAPGPPAS
jgi:hypothetical protein